MVEWASNGLKEMGKYEILASEHCHNIFRKTWTYCNSNRYKVIEPEYDVRLLLGKSKGEEY